jgi:hypothetical protein
MTTAGTTGKSILLWKAWVGALLAFLLTFGAGVAYSYFTTPPPPGVSPSTCRWIRQGMEEHEVERLMGCTGDRQGWPQTEEEQIFRVYYRGKEGVVIVDYQLKDARSDWRHPCTGIVVKAEWWPNSSFIYIGHP